MRCLLALSALLALLLLVRLVPWRAPAALPGSGSVAADAPRTAATPAATARGRATQDVPADRRVRILPASLRQDFESAPDLYDYVQRLEPALRAADPDAAWMLSRVYDYCAAYAVSPAGYAKDSEALAAMGLRVGTTMLAARQRVSQRCARFAPQDGLSSRVILLKRTEAAQKGSLAAEASLLAMGQPLQDDAAYLRDLVRRVRESRDPEAFLALSSAMGIAASGKPELADQVAGTQFAELAWQLAACELGLDCDSQSALMTAYCADGGICSRDAGQDFRSFVYDAAVPRQGAEDVDEMVDSLVSEERG